MKRQMSDHLSVGILLAISGGLMDAYSYLFRGKVFANAQTGNILLFSVHFAQREWVQALHYLCPIAAFSCGIALAAIIRHITMQHGSLHWRQICVLFEAIILFFAAYFPQEWNLFANALISLACGTQVEAFRKIERTGVATTMCIGNLRLAIHSAVEHHFMHSQDDRHAAHISTSIILAFAVGAVFGSVVIRRFGAYSIWCSTLLLLICFAMMFSVSTERKGR